MPHAANQQPHHTRSAGSDLKLHLRVVPLHGREYRVLTLRPGTRAAFSTNYFHNTWHIVSDLHGARLLSRLLWFLAYQRVARTLVALYGEHLRPTPFEAEPSQPILLAPAPLTPLDAGAFRLLKARLPHPGASQGTVRCRTYGLDQELQQEHPGSGGELGELWRRESQHLWQAEQMRSCGGWICYTAPPPVLRARAVSIHQMRVTSYPMDYQYLAKHGGGCYPDGEVQIFRDYHAMLSVATEARRELANRGALPQDPWKQRTRIWRQCRRIRTRRLRSRTDSVSGG